MPHDPFSVACLPGFMVAPEDAGERAWAGEAYPAPALMIQGTTSDAGKSVLCAGLARIFRQDGFKTAPFKAQNMTGFAYTLPCGGRMGMAQVIQAWAAGLEPDVRMNPVLLMPSSQTGSDVVVLGESRGNMQGRDYFARKRELFPTVAAAYNGLAAAVSPAAAGAGGNGRENEEARGNAQERGRELGNGREFGNGQAPGQGDGPGIMLLEGAGSPAEINLRAHDIVNMHMAAFAKARVLLVGDIDRGGVFAGLVGTLALLAPWERDLVAGLIINKFRGDVSLLEPGLIEVEEITGKPVLGVIPHIDDLGLPEEDSLSGRGRDTWSCKSSAEFAEFKQEMDVALDRLADVVRQSLNMDYIYRECLGVA